MMNERWEHWEDSIEPKVFSEIDRLSAEGKLWLGENENGEDMDMWEFQNYCDKFRKMFEDEIRDLDFPEMLPLIRAVEDADDYKIFIDLSDYTQILENLREEEIAGEFYPVLAEYFVRNEGINRTWASIHNEPYDAQIPDIVYRAYEEYFNELDIIRDQAQEKCEELA